MRGRRMSRRIVITQSELYPLIGKLYVENLAYQRVIAEMEEAHAAQEREAVVPSPEGASGQGDEEVQQEG